MFSMQPSSDYGDGPEKPRWLFPALAGGYVAGYSAALGTGFSLEGSSTTEATVAALSQATTAALCWIFLIRNRM